MSKRGLSPAIVRRRAASGRRRFLAAAIPVLVLLSAAFLAAFGLPLPRDPIAGFPGVVLWAWERPEQLGFIEPHEACVAFLARTLDLRGDDVLPRPRLQPLSVPDGAALMAVVRIESSRSAPPTLSANQRGRAVSEIVEATESAGVRAVQVDFDATLSERAFYRDLLRGLRRQLQPGISLAITALASWCLHDNWLEGLPVDDAVPMLFRMGVDDRQVRRHLQAGRDFRTPACRRSVGISTDEPPPRLPAGRRLYIFHPEAWSREAVQRALTEARRWQ